MSYLEFHGVLIFSLIINTLFLLLVPSITRKFLVPGTFLSNTFDSVIYHLILITGIESLGFIILTVYCLFSNGLTGVPILDLLKIERNFIFLIPVCFNMMAVLLLEGNYYKNTESLRDDPRNFMNYNFFYKSIILSRKSLRYLIATTVFVVFYTVYFLFFSKYFNINDEEFHSLKILICSLITFGGGALCFVFKLSPIEYTIEQDYKRIEKLERISNTVGVILFFAGWILLYLHY